MLKKKEILDFGFVRLIDFMGGDRAVVQAARVSFGKDIADDERDKKLVFYLMDNRHETPFEHSTFKFHVKCPIFVARQWFRHRMSSYNEISGRYAKMNQECFLPDHFRTQKAKNYQYDNVGPELNANVREKVRDFYQDAFQLYQELLNDGIAKEHARMVLPMALYTQFYWTVNARSLLNFLSLRLDIHAQYEIRVYAEAIKELFRDKMPWTLEAFERYVIHKEKTNE